MTGRMIIGLLMISALSGCIATDIGRSIKGNLQGDYYLSTKKYDRGEQEFRQLVKAHPENAHFHYYLARILLAKKQPAISEALEHLRKAVSLNQRQADYLFWQGLAYGAIGEAPKEKESYLLSLKQNKDHLQALTYLGHNLLEAGEFEAALALYQKVLKLWPASPAALFNRALIMGKLGRTPEEKLAWKIYLDNYPAGAMASQAAKKLNALGVFDYKNFTIGSRTITLEKIQFEPFSDRIMTKSGPSLHLLSAVVENMKHGTLHVVVYQKGNKALAKLRAHSISKYLTGELPKNWPGRIALSWFDVGEEKEVNGKTYVEDESVLFFFE